VPHAARRRQRGHRWRAAAPARCHVAEGFEDGEGEILGRLRAIIGPDVPVVVTLDLHGNITEKMDGGIGSRGAVAVNLMLP
jgi:hypothetical protein